MPPQPGANDIPRNHVPGRGLLPAPVMIVGEAPGRNENSTRMPFVGQAGQELERYARTAGLDLANCYITNLAKWWPPVDFRGNQLPPTPEDIARDEPELLGELLMCEPRVIVAVGAHAARYFLPKFSNMRTEHGLPQLTWIEVLGREVPVIAVLHPAAGLHSGTQEEMARIQWDFQQVGKLVRGQLPLTRVDRYPNPQYRRLFDLEDGPRILANLLAGRTEVAIDTEGTIEDPECLTLCVTPGEGWMIEAGQTETLAALDRHINAPHGICTVILHYMTHDLPVIEVLGVRLAHRPAVNSDGSPTFRDTMNELHLLGGIEPKGLKAAEWRLCAMEADSFEDVAGESAYETARDYFEHAFGIAACELCVGVGKTDKPYKVVDPACKVCGGSGRVASVKACDCRVVDIIDYEGVTETTTLPVDMAKPDCITCCGIGEIPTGRTKYCKCVKTSDACEMPECVDGLLIPAPAKELNFDATTGEFRWKQPQSMAKWLKRKILAPDMLSKDDGQDEQGEQLASASTDEDEQDAAPLFKLRKAWRDLPPERRALVERVAGRMPRVALRNVKDQARVTRYACRDADATLRVSRETDKRVRQYGLQAAREIDIAILPMLSRMERSGMMIDRGHFEAFHGDLQRWLSEERTKLADLVGEHNPNSKRMIGVLFRDLQLPAIKMTAGGQESTDDETLGILKAQLKARQAGGQDSELVRTGVQVIDCIQTYREFQKMDSTYVLGLLGKADAHDRVHTTINYTKSVSRLSSEDPNLQNIPNPDNSPYPDDAVRNMGLRMRRGFVARPGCKIIEADYSAIEMVVGAHLTQDRNLMRIFHEGLDPHRYAASEFLKMPMADVPKPVRTQFKNLNFASFYDTSAMTIQRQLSLMQPPIDMSVEECQQLINWYFSEFAPDVLAWKDRVRRDAQAEGVVRTMFGRMRWMPGLRSQIKWVRSAAERECTNFPIQGTARDILCVGMARMWEDLFPELWAAGVDAQPIMTVHDAVAVECPAEFAEFVGDQMREVMEQAVGLSVPVKVSVGIGDNWAEAH